MNPHDPLEDPHQLQCLHHQISDAQSFFGQQLHELHPNYMHAAYASAPSASPSIDSNTSGVFGIVKLKTEVPADVQQDLDKATECMMGLSALGMAYCQRVAVQAKDPSRLFDTSTWESVLMHYPLLGPFTFQRTGYSKSVRGIELSSEFLKQLLGFAGAAPVVAAFQAFIGSFGEKIQAGVNISDKPFHFAANTVFVDAQKLGDRWMILPRLKMFFCDFTSKQRKVFTSCASSVMVDVKLDYIEVDTVWNYLQYKNNADVQRRFDELIGTRAGKQITDAKNFFDWLV